MHTTAFSTHGINIPEPTTTAKHVRVYSPAPFAGSFVCIRHPGFDLPRAEIGCKMVRLNFACRTPADTNNKLEKDCSVGSCVSIAFRLIGFRVRVLCRCVCCLDSCLYAGPSGTVHACSQPPTHTLEHRQAMSEQVRSYAYVSCFRVCVVFSAQCV